MDFYTFVYIWIGIALITFGLLFKVKAPYGRHSQTSWGMMIDNRLGWFLMELPALLVCPYFFWIGEGEKSTVTYFFVGLWLLHYINRTLIFPLRQRTTGKKMPILIMLMAVSFNGVNGYICGHYLGNIAIYPPSWWLSIPFIIGIVLFVGGLFLNWQADHILLNLRKPQETGYKIPYGGGFRWISCPNHFGEIIEWIGFGIMTFSIPTASFAIWTIANLLPRSLEHHQWYLERFPDYPKSRKAVIPYLL